MFKPCPFCGSTVYRDIGFNGITFFNCSNEKCGATVSFKGLKLTSGGSVEHENPTAAWNARAGEAPVH
jgi:hypothetical protein